MFRYFVITIYVIVSASSLRSQNTTKPCKVLLEKISGNYNGDCKKGLAHGHGIAQGEDTYIGDFRKGLPSGKGLYTYKNGDSFFGYWKNGKKDGIGEMRYYSIKTDSTISGKWKNDTLIGNNKFDESYHVSFKRSIQDYSFEKTKDDENQIEISFEVVMNKFFPKNLSFEGSSGHTTPYPKKIVILEPRYPFIGNVEYQIKYQNAWITCNFIFTIKEKGKWHVILKHY